VGAIRQGSQLRNAAFERRPLITQLSNMYENGIIEIA